LENGCVCRKEKEEKEDFFGECLESGKKGPRGRMGRGIFTVELGLKVAQPR